MIDFFVEATISPEKQRADSDWSASQNFMALVFLIHSESPASERVLWYQKTIKPTALFVKGGLSDTMLELTLPIRRWNMEYCRHAA